VKSADRQRFIVDQLQAAEQVSVAELATAIGTSEMTVRRDLDLLAASGVLRRVHGGAVLASPSGVEPPFASRAIAVTATKRAIAAATVELIQDGETVLLDSGTTALEVARLLHDRAVTVMPLSLHAIHELVDAPKVRLLLPGGEPRPGELSLIGPLTLASMRALRFDVAVLSPCAFSVDDGLTAFDLNDAEIKQQALTVASRVIVMADGTKWGKAALAHVCPADRPDVVVTDPSAPEDQRAALAERGVLVHVATEQETR
jgi:DeoR/GlpR family transcriptional regulator of sugar metabolism